MFLLKERLFNALQAEERGEPNASGKNDSPKTSRKKSPAVFHRSWTHNEQLILRPCGVFISRATFYQAEAVSGVKVCYQSLVSIMK